ncbi:MAG TPA: TonB-dependent receptor [Pyrinomonadaceae bacterium]|nr:TonB-dependent receptor [Pyrinomonadaceae bacterium]
MTRGFLLTLFLSITSSFSFAQGTGSISGTVTLNDSSVLHDAEVHIIQLKRSVRTGDDGKYRIADVPPGRYTILVHSEGFADSSKSIDVTGAADVVADFQLSIQSIKEQVTVTASGTEQSVFESFQTVNSVGSTRIAERASTSLGEVLETESGVAKRSFGPGSSRPVIRGFDGDRVLVLQDGVRSGSVGSQSGDHGETVDPLSAERIEVVKGPGTLLYGSNALGGVVNVIGHHEDEAHDGVRGFFTGVGGTADKQAAASGGIEYGVKKWLFRGNISAQRTGDYKTPIGTIPNSASRSNTFTGGLGYYGNKAYISGSYGLDVRRYGIPFAAIFEEEPPAEGELPDVDEEIDIRARRHNARITGGFRNFTNPFLSGVQYSIDYSDYRHKEIERADGVDEVGTIFDNKTVSYRSLFEQAKMGRLTGRFGVEGFNRDYQVQGAEQLIQGTVKHNAFSVFALEELGFERVKFQFGGRVEHNRYNPENTALVDRSYTGFSGGFGVNFSLWKGGAFIANYTHSFRAPALEELYNNGPHIGNVTFEIGNNDLRNESSNGLDFSLRHQSDKLRFSGDVYYYQISDFVFLAPQDVDGDGQIDRQDGLPVARYEQSDARYVGAELSGEAKFNKYVGGFIGLDFVRARLVDEGLDLPRIPPARARIGLDLQYRALSVRPEAVFVADQEKIFPLETRTAGYGIFNVSGSYTIARQHVAHIVTFNAYNLTDRLYRNHVSFIKDLVPEIGRGIRIGYTVRFF